MLRVASRFVQGRNREEDTRSDFRGTWMLVAQWDHVHPDPHGADDHMGIPEALLERVGGAEILLTALLAILLYYRQTPTRESLLLMVSIPAPCSRIHVVTSSGVQQETGQLLWDTMLEGLTLRTIAPRVLIQLVMMSPVLLS